MKNDTYLIESLSHEGRGIATENGKKLFIGGALPGERVRVAWTKKNRHFAQGQAIEVDADSLSPDRVTPACPHIEICGGCSLQHLSPKIQLALKEKTLLDQLAHFGHVVPEKILTPQEGPLWNYRRRARLSVKFVTKKNSVLVGFREKNGRYVADISSCAILISPFNALIPDLKQLIATLAIKEQIPQIEIAAGDNGNALIFRILTPLMQNDLNTLIDFGKNHELHIYIQPGNQDSLEKIYPAHPVALQYTLPNYSLHYDFLPFDFIQINPIMNKLMIEKALELLALKQNETVLDLFCGLGNITLPMARFAKNVVGIEGDAKLIERAKQNAALNAIANVAFFAADLTSDIKHNPWVKSYDAILLDPPRTGARELIFNLANAPAKRIVYVSCNPATLARDAEVLVHQQNYRLKAAGILDMFPHTAHVESIALFVREDLW